MEQKEESCYIWMNRVCRVDRMAQLGDSVTIRPRLPCRKTTCAQAIRQLMMRAKTRANHEPFAGISKKRIGYLNVYIFRVSLSPLTCAHVHAVHRRCLLYRHMEANCKQILRQNC